MDIDLKRLLKIVLEGQNMSREESRAYKSLMDILEGWSLNDVEIALYDYEGWSE